MARRESFWQNPPPDGPRPEPVEGRLVFERGRARVSLDGAWRLHADPMKSGRRRGYWNEPRQQRAGRPVEYDYAAWTPVRVPGDWNTQVRELAHFDGWGWYARRFAFRPRPGERLFLRFGAVNYRAEAWLNGRRLGAHEGGFTPFEFEVTGLVGAENLLVVLADSTMRPDGAPTNFYDWFNYGGITRSVEILRVPRAFIRDFRVALVERRGRTLIRAEVEIDGRRLPRTARFEVPALGVKASILLAAGRGAVEVAAEPVRWTPERPKLYAVRLWAGADSISDRVGFRTLARRGHEILLNGRPVYLRGVCLHEERPVPGGGRTLPRREARALLGEARALGCNFVRLAHYPHTEEMARAADRLGLMLWEEIPVYWGVQFLNSATLANCRQQLRELVRRDFNRASVIMWSVGNETPNRPERDRFFGALAREARRLDRTRLVTAAFVVEQSPATKAYGAFNGAVRHLDVVGLNEYFGWYVLNGRSDLDHARWDLAGLGRPVVFSEFGAEARCGVHGRVGDRWTEEDQADVYRRQLRMIRRLKLCAGMAPWLLVDFRSSHRANRFQRGYNLKGLVGVGLRRKLAFKVLRDFYAERRR